MKRLTAVLLSAIQIMVLVCYLSSCIVLKDSATILGEITYVSKAYNDKDFYFYLLTKGFPENSEWILFKADADAMDFLDFDGNDIDELVGKTVEIEFDIEVKAPGGDGKCYHAKKVSPADGTSVSSGNPNLDLLVNERYLLEFDGGSCGAIGEVKHVAFVNSTVNGYIIYIDEGLQTLSAYFFNEEAVVDDDVIEKIESGETDVTVRISGRMAYPFYDRNIREGNSVHLYSN